MNSMTFKLCDLSIDKNVKKYQEQPEELGAFAASMQEKLDMFYLVDRIDKDSYEMLTNKLRYFTGTSTDVTE